MAWLSGLRREVEEQQREGYEERLTRKVKRVEAERANLAAELERVKAECEQRVEAVLAALVGSDQGVREALEVVQGEALGEAARKRLREIAHAHDRKHHLVLKDARERKQVYDERLQTIQAKGNTQHVALVVGCAEYQRLPPNCSLQNSTNDAADFAECLRKFGYVHCGSLCAWLHVWFVLSHPPTLQVPR
eukprot:m.411963 g.411963  ORF g.411963 m.411963 type:complete len:191 (+) comp20168_c0_seq10:1615-2187(+)